MVQWRTANRCINRWTKYPWNPTRIQSAEQTGLIPFNDDELYHWCPGQVLLCPGTCTKCEGERINLETTEEEFFTLVFFKISFLVYVPYYVNILIVVLSTCLKPVHADYCVKCDYFWTTHLYQMNHLTTSDWSRPHVTKYLWFNATILSDVAFLISI